MAGKAIETFRMIEESDVVMVCLSGGKDSYTLLEILRALQARAPISFELIAVNLDQKQPGFPASTLPEYLKSIGVDFKIVEEDTYSIVKDKIPAGKTMCSLALGHHREDILETFFLNLMFGGRLKAMPAKLRSDDGRHVVIRPLSYCAENDIARYARARQFPVIPCDLCGSQENLQRQAIKAMLNEWEKNTPGRKEIIFQALARVTPTHLMDPGLFDFRSLAATSITEAAPVVADASRQFSTR